MKALRLWIGFVSFCRNDSPLILLVFIIYANIPEVLRSDLGISKCMTVLMLLLSGVIIIRRSIDGKWSEGWAKPACCLGAYGLACLLSLSQASETARAVRDLTHYFKGAAVVVLIVLLLTEMNTLRRVVWTLLAAGILLGSISVIQHVSGTYEYDYLGFGRVSVEHIVGSTDSHRTRGVLDEPNYYAMILLFLTPLALERLWSARMALSWLASAWALAACVLAMILTYSRGAVVASAAGLILMAVLAWRIPPRRLNLLVTILAPILMLPLVPYQYYERMMTLRYLLVVPSSISATAFDPKRPPPAVNDSAGPGATPASVLNGSAITAEPSFRGRLSEVIVAWQMFVDHPYLGVGCGNYETHYQRYARPLGLDPRRTEREPHNLYLEVAAETGLVGVVTFGALLCTLLCGMWRSQRLLLKHGLMDDARMIGAFEIGIIAYLISSLFLMSIWTYHFWLVAGIAFAIPQATRSILPSRPCLAASACRSWLLHDLT